MEELKGTIDVIGLDVFQTHRTFKDKEEAQEFLSSATRESFDTVEIDNETFIIRSTISDLNRVTSVIPEDLHAKVAIQVQVKIAEILQNAGIKVGIDQDALTEIEESNSDDQLVPANNVDYVGSETDNTK